MIYYDLSIVVATLKDSSEHIRIRIIYLHIIMLFIKFYARIAMPHMLTRPKGN